MRPHYLRRDGRAPYCVWNFIRRKNDDDDDTTCNNFLLLSSWACACMFVCLCVFYRGNNSIGGVKLFYQQCVA